MSDTGRAAAAADTQKKAKRGFFRGWVIIAFAAVLAAAAGGGAFWYFLVARAPGHGQAAAQQEPPLPFYLEVKPFVVSMMSNSGVPRFVQIGVNLTLSGSGVGNLVNAMLPEVQDTMRLTVLGFKVEDLENPAGVDKVRAAMTADINKLLVRRLGAERIERVNGGSKDAVENLFFSTLVVE